MINRVVLVGNLTKDPVLRKTQSGQSVTSFTLAINRRSKEQDQADFINCTAWNQPGEYLAQYAKKGNTIGVEGRITTRNYDDKDGKKVYVTEVVCDNVNIIKSAQGSVQSPAYQPSSTQPAPKATTGYFPDDNPSNDEFNTGPLLDISSDDLPF
jgi:single-strand DNA-binding protein